MSEQNRKIEILTKRVNNQQKLLDELTAESEKNRKLMAEMIQFIKPYTQRINIIRQAAFTSGVKIDYLLEKAYAIEGFGASDEDLKTYMDDAEKQVQAEQEKIQKQAEAKQEETSYEKHLKEEKAEANS